MKQLAQTRDSLRSILQLDTKEVTAAGGAPGEVAWAGDGGLRRSKAGRPWGRFVGRRRSIG